MHVWSATPSGQAGANRFSIRKSVTWNLPFRCLDRGTVVLLEELLMELKHLKNCGRWEKLVVWKANWIFDRYCAACASQEQTGRFIAKPLMPQTLQPFRWSKCKFWRKDKYKHWNETNTNFEEKTNTNIEKRKKLEKNTLFTNAWQLMLMNHFRFLSDFETTLLTNFKSF